MVRNCDSDAEEVLQSKDVRRARPDFCLVRSSRQRKDCTIAARTIGVMSLMTFFVQHLHIVQMSAKCLRSRVRNGCGTVSFAYAPFASKKRKDKDRLCGSSQPSDLEICG